MESPSDADQLICAVSSSPPRHIHEDQLLEIRHEACCSAGQVGFHEFLAGKVKGHPRSNIRVAKSALGIMLSRNPNSEMTEHGFEGVLTLHLRKHCSWGVLFFNF